MYGPAIVVRSMSSREKADGAGNPWQYHPRSDDHSKVACWSVLFDLLVHCEVLRAHAASGRIGFGINHEMRDFKNNRAKKLDLVVCTPGTESLQKRGRSRFDDDFARKAGIRLLPEEAALLDDLPVFHETPVGSVRIALEAKACMTAHGKARPRLYDELNSSHLTVHGSSDVAIAAAFVMVNVAKSFVSPLNNRDSLAITSARVNSHDQPRDAASVLEKVRQLPRRVQPHDEGYDALGIVVVDARNDGSPITLANEPPAPPVGDNFHYDQLISRICASYQRHFGGN